MKPAPFEHVPVETVEEAVAALAEHGDEAKVLAGGQSLVPLLNLRLARPASSSTSTASAGLDGIGTNGALSLGALVRQADALRLGDVWPSTQPLLTRGAPPRRPPGDEEPRHDRRLLAHADPAAELPAVLLALDGEVVVSGPYGERTILAGDLFLAPFATSLAATSC